jgi:hypothetical protein
MYGLRPMQTNFNIKQGQEHGNSKLKDTQVREIKRLLLIKTSLTSIAKQFNVAVCTISDIKDHRSWKHIPFRVLNR